MEARSVEGVVDVQKKIDELNSFFEKKQIHKMLEEFIEVQSSFHHKMQNFIHACTEIAKKLPEADEQRLLRLLSPYGALIANPFPETSCGDMRKDIEDILMVINSRSDQHFHKLVSALMLSAANILELQTLLEKYHSDVKLKEVILHELKAKSWSEVGMHVTHPVQQLARYELLLKAFDKTLADNGLNPTVKIRSEFSEALVRVMPELTFFNEQRELLTQLNHIEEMLTRMAPLDLVRVDPVRVYTKAIRRNIAEGKVEVLDALQGLRDLLAMLQKTLEPSILGKGAHLLRGASYYGVTFFTDPLFGENAVLSKPDDPYAELGAVILSLDRQCDMIRCLQEKQGTVVIRPT